MLASVFLVSLFVWIELELNKINYIFNPISIKSISFLVCVCVLGTLSLLLFQNKTIFALS